LPEPILTTDLIGKFEEIASSLDEKDSKAAKLQALIEQLPKSNQTLLSWIILHLHSVIQNEKYNKMKEHNLAMHLSPPLQMSFRLLLLFLTHCMDLFSDVQLIK